MRRPERQLKLPFDEPKPWQTNPPDTTIPPLDSEQARIAINNFLAELREYQANREQLPEPLPF
ncbi:MAG: hypothetical protein SFX18_19535 [Pirellulales bacterium]|nr:hypothetical protein [Pirellulales bacterium]